MLVFQFSDLSTQQNIIITFPASSATLSVLRNVPSSKPPSYLAWAWVITELCLLEYHFESSFRKERKAYINLTGSYSVEIIKNSCRPCRLCFCHGNTKISCPCVVASSELCLLTFRPLDSSEISF